MNLLAAASYDPSTAVSKSTASLLAMTAVDTTNLRLAVTVPAHGLVRFYLRCVIVGATTFPQIFLGVLNGATVVGRVAPTAVIGGTALATTRVVCEGWFTATGLTPGAANFDAAYGVEIVLAATNIKYGGPNNTTSDDAWGAFVFEAWDPRPIKLGLDGGVNVTQLLGTAWLTPGTAGTPDVNVKLWNALTTVALPLVPTVAGRTLDVSAGGEAGIDWANVGTPATAVDLSNTTIKTTQTIGTVTNAVTLSAGDSPVLQSGTATAGGASTITIQTALGADSLPVGCAIKITSGTGAKQARVVTAYVDATKVVTVDRPWTTNPDATSVYTIVYDNVPALSAGLKITGVVLTDTTTTVTNQLTAAAIATGVWQDATAGDFTVASSVGKALYINNVAPGGAGGHFISGSNAGTTTFGAVTVTGNMLLSDGLTVAAPSTLNRAGITITGNGSGAGVIATGGATGHGISFVGGATSGSGISSVASTSGDGITATGAGTTKHGISATGGATSSHGINAAGGGTGAGIRALGGATGHGINSVGGGTSGDGFRTTGGTSGAGITATGAGAGNSGMNVSAQTSAAGISIAGASGNGVTVTGGGNGSGIAVTGAGSGHGVIATGGATGDGVVATAAPGSGSGHGITATGVGVTKHGINATGGGTTSDGIRATGGGIGHGMNLISGAGNPSHGLKTTSLAGGSGIIATGEGVGDGITAVGGVGGVDVRGVLADLSVTAVAEPGQAAPAAASTLASKISYLFKAWRNKSDQTSSLYQLYNDDAVTVDQKATVSDDGTTFVRGEVASGP